MTAQDRINQYWTGRAPAYDDYQQRPDRAAADDRAWADIWAAALPPAPLDVLDVGTGSGQVAMVLAGLGVTPPVAVGGSRCCERLAWSVQPRR